MGSAPSKKNEEQNDVVSLCKERKRLLKKAIEYRYALADAQFNYNHSLYAVSASLRLFIARYSSPSSQFLITSSETTETSVVPKPLFLQNRATEPTHQTINPCSLNEEGDSESEEVCEHFYGDNPTPISNPQRDFGWDFFYPFNNGVKMVNGFNGECDEDLRLIREEEGIPELEKDREGTISAEKVRDVNNGDLGHEEGGGGGRLSMKKEEGKGLAVIDSANGGRELLEALKDVEDQFLKAYGSGMEVSRMLETKMVQVQSALEEIKGGYLYLSYLGIVCCLC